jgi:hypothetical protein
MHVAAVFLPNGFPNVTHDAVPPFSHVFFLPTCLQAQACALPPRIAAPTPRRIVLIIPSLQAS